MRTLLKDESGFTLMEMLVVLVLLGLVMTGVYEFMSTSNGFSNAVGNENDYQNLATDVMYSIRAELSDAEGVKATDVSDVTTYTFAGGYTYLIEEPDGGFTKYVCTEEDDGTVTTDKMETVGNVTASKGYKVELFFSTDYNASDTSSSVNAMGNVTVSVKSLNDDGSGSFADIYTLKSDIVLRSTSDAGSGNAIMFKTPDASTP